MYCNSGICDVLQCRRSVDCERDDQICSLGFCQKVPNACSVDVDCETATESCIHGICSEFKKCESDDNCLNTQECSFGRCVYKVSCSNFVHCSEESACVGRTCRSKTCKKSGLSSFCPIDLICASINLKISLCLPDIKCTAVGNVKRVKSCDVETGKRANSCDNDSDCSLGFFCKNKKVCSMRRGCDSTKDCHSSEFCSTDGYCSRKMTQICLKCEPLEFCTPVGCKKNEIQINPKKNKQRCEFDKDCPHRRTCLSGQCEIGIRCSSGADCPNFFECGKGKICQRRLCSSDLDCTEQNVLGLCHKGVCTPPINCVSKCKMGFICVNGYCLRRCDQDGQCQSSFKCQLGACFSDVSCGTFKRCPFGKICGQNGICVDPQCEVDGECGTNEVCNGYKCVFSNEPCDHNKKCEKPKEKCYHGYCEITRLCERDSDCQNPKENCVMRDEKRGTCILLKPCNKRKKCLYPFQTCDAKGNCVPQKCGQHSDCTEGRCHHGLCFPLHYCMNGKCFEKEFTCSQNLCRLQCDQDRNCGSQSICLRSKVCVASKLKCPCDIAYAGYQCSIPLNLKRCSIIECYSDEQCEPEEICHFGHCITEIKLCSNDLDCLYGFSCSSGVCTLLKPCAFGCSPGFECRGEWCTPIIWCGRKKGDRPCPIGMNCNIRDGKCNVDSCSPATKGKECSYPLSCHSKLSVCLHSPQCRISSDCHDSDICYAGRCYNHCSHEGATCDEGFRCHKEKGICIQFVNCLHSRCAPGFKCEEDAKNCEPVGCLGKSDCHNSNRPLCAFGQCVGVSGKKCFGCASITFCSKEDKCSPGFHCEKNICIIPLSCNRDHQCPVLMKCIRGKCGLISCNEKDCSLGHCISNVCVPKFSCSECQKEEICSKNNYKCLKKCDLQTHCQSKKEICMKKACHHVSKCNYQKDCPLNHYCLQESKTCFPFQCVKDWDCRIGFYCGVERKCTPILNSCQSNKDCKVRGNEYFCDGLSKSCKNINKTILSCENSACPLPYVCRKDKTCVKRVCHRHKDCSIGFCGRDDKCTTLKCIHDGDCVEIGGICVENNCVKTSCDECGVNETCILDRRSGFCWLKLSCLEKSCPRGRICRNGVCIPPRCRYNWECKYEGGNCIDFRCSKEKCSGEKCLPTVQCLVNEDCSGGFGKMKCVRKEDKIGICVRESSTCQKDHHCKEFGGLCINETCTLSSCFRSSCDNGMRCDASASTSCPWGKICHPFMRICVEHLKCSMPGKNCPEGYLCDKENKCLLLCKSSLECSFDGEECFFGICRLPNERSCKNQDDCHQGSFCHPGGMCSDNCLFPFVASTTTGKCRLSFIRCSSDNDCPHRTKCETSSDKCILLECETDENCKSLTDTCIAGLCRRHPETPCSFHGTECGINRICRLGICSSLCKNDDDCNKFSTNLVCEKQFCIYSPKRACRLSKDCKYGMICEIGKCRYLECGFANCRNGQECVFGKCANNRKQLKPPSKIGCLSDRHCPQNDMICLRGQCRSQSCTTSDECSLDKACRSRICTIYGSCKSHKDCLSTQKCFDKMCRNQCDLNKDCPPSQFCLGGFCRFKIHCQKSESCPVRSYCGSHHYCVSPECTSDEDCEGTFSCIKYRCQTKIIKCSKNSDCLEGRVCFDQRCVSLRKCERDLDCQSFAQICVNGGCEPLLHCFSDKNCMNGYRCKRHRCTFVKKLTLCDGKGDNCYCKKDSECSTHTEICLGGKCRKKCGKRRRHRCVEGDKCVGNVCISRAHSCKGRECPLGWVCSDSKKCQLPKCERNEHCPGLNYRCMYGQCIAFSPRRPCNKGLCNDDTCYVGQCLANSCLLRRCKKPYLCSKSTGLCIPKIKCHSSEHCYIDGMECDKSLKLCVISKKECSLEKCPRCSDGVCLPALICTKDEDCGPGKGCLMGICYPLCTKDCPYCVRNKYCVPEISCPCTGKRGFYCSKGICRVACRKSDDCKYPSETYCFRGICGNPLLACILNSDCVEEEVCENKTCIRRNLKKCYDEQNCEKSIYCEEDTDCGYPRCVCRSKSCACDGCKTDEDCSSEQTCKNNACTSVSVACKANEDCPGRHDKCFKRICLKKCLENYNCPQSNECLLGHCSVGLKCSDCIGGRCVKGQCIPLECETHSDCYEYLETACLYGKCRKITNIEDFCADAKNCSIECKTSADCINEDEICDNKFCIPKVTCRKNYDCPKGMKCGNQGTCSIFSCFDNLECKSLLGSFSECRGICVFTRHCLVDTDCGLKRTCRVRKCLSRCDNSDEECEKGLHCVNKVCIPRISCINLNCPRGLYCKDRICIPPECRKDIDCPKNGATCFQGSCQRLSSCNIDNKCPANEVCVGNICLQEYCRSGFDGCKCIFGFCIPYIRCRANDSDKYCFPGSKCQNGRCCYPTCYTSASCDGLFCRQVLSEVGVSKMCLPPTNCLSSRDCNGDETCVKGKCYLKCRDGLRPCIDYAEYCEKNTNTCRPKITCESPLDCKDQTDFCVAPFHGDESRYCFPSECMFTKDCPINHFCDFGKCVVSRPCLSDRDCEIGFEICSDKRCQIIWSVTDCKNCSLKTHVCRNEQCFPFRPCNSHNNACPQNTICEENLCIPKKCKSDSECYPNFCHSGLCRIRPGCFYDRDCDFGFSCISHQCLRPCFSSKDCNGAKCLRGFCTTDLYMCQKGSEDCPWSGMLCFARHCLKPECLETKDCPSYFYCQYGKCATNPHCENCLSSHHSRKLCINGRCKPFKLCSGFSSCTSSFESCQIEGKNQICLSKIFCESDKHCPMESMTCGKNKYCVIKTCSKKEDCGNYLKCEENSKCISPVEGCVRDSDCEPNQSCLKGKCRSIRFCDGVTITCDDHEDEYCNIHTKKCEPVIFCSSASDCIWRGMSCDVKGICVRIECKTDEHCEPFESCYDGFCNTPYACNIDKDCELKTMSSECYKNRCLRVTTCKTNEDCPIGICSLNRCATNGIVCSSHSDCPSPLFCSEHNICQEKGCESELDCRSTHKTCHMKTQCLPLPYCVKNDDCQKGLECDKNHVCSNPSQQQCRTSEDCLPVYVCLYGKCSLLPCSDSNPCSNYGALCLLGECQIPECLKDKDCSSFQYCHRGRCFIAKYCNGVLCPKDFHCYYNRCYPNEKCKDGRCLSKVKTCQTSRNCFEGNFCFQGICLRKYCSEHRDCPPQRECVRGNCLPFFGCELEKDCIESQVCSEGRCIQKIPCRNKRDCKSFNGWCHRENYCLPRSYFCVMGSDCPWNSMICQNNRCMSIDCFKDSDCFSPSKFCNQGKCRHLIRCRNDNDCGQNQFCNKDICSSLTRCHTFKDCLSGFCDNSLCIYSIGCQTHSHCPVGMLCRGNQCGYLYCAEEGKDCPPRFQCSKGLCLAGVPSCHSAKNCPPSHRCLKGHCRAIQCKLSSDCVNKRSVCWFGICLDRRPSKKWLCARKQNVYDKISGLCVPFKKCSTSKKCSSEDQCDSALGYCVPSISCISNQDCPSNAHCTKNKICSRDKCKKEGSSSCSDHHYCFEDVCIPSMPCSNLDKYWCSPCLNGNCHRKLICSKNTDCPYHICDSGYCSLPSCSYSSSADCSKTGISHCLYTTSRCYYAPLSKCRNHRDCSKTEDLICINRLCVKHANCQKHRDCPKGFRCGANYLCQRIRRCRKDTDCLTRDLVCDTKVKKCVRGKVSTGVQSRSLRLNSGPKQKGKEYSDPTRLVPTLP